MKPINYALTAVVFALILSVVSCSKFDWKHHGKKFPLIAGDCDVERIYAAQDGGGTRVEMEKTYNAAGLANTIGFYTYSATTETTWHRLSLIYNAYERTVVIVDSATGGPVLKAIFNSAGRLERLKRLQGETSDFADRTFEYSGGRLVKIHSLWKTFNDTETFTYDANGNIKTRTKGDGGTVTEAAEFFYGAAATDKKQLYIPNFNYLIVVDPSMVMLEYLRWIKDFSPKNILTEIEYTNPLPSNDTYTAHTFDSDGKLTSYSDGDYVGGTKNLVWRCLAAKSDKAGY